MEAQFRKEMKQRLQLGEFEESMKSFVQRLQKYFRNSTSTLFFIINSNLFVLFFFSIFSNWIMPTEFGAQMSKRIGILESEMTGKYEVSCILLKPWNKWNDFINYKKQKSLKKILRTTEPASSAATDESTKKIKQLEREVNDLRTEIRNLEIHEKFKVTSFV